MALVGSVTGSVNLGGASTFISSSNGSSVEIGASTQVLVLSGGAASSLNPRNFPDVNFFVSGTLGSVGSSTRGTSLLGGDAFISGSLTFGGDATLPNATSRMVNSGQYAYWQNWYPTNPVINMSGKFGASLFMFQLIATDVGISGKVRLGANGTGTGTARLHITASSGAASTAPIKIDSGSLLATPEAGTIEYDATSFYVTSGTTRQTILTTLKNNAAVTSSFMVSTASNMTLRVPGGGGETNRAIVMTRNETPVPTFGSDAFLFVTGAAFAKDDASDRGTAVFAGDMVLSGNLWGGYQTFGGLNATQLNLKGSSIVLGGGGGFAPGAPTPQNAPDVAVFISGSTNSKGGATRGTTLIGGDVVISGTLYDGSGVAYTAGAGGGGGGGDSAASYVVIALTSSLSNERVLTAGTGISITDGGANGNVTISATGGSSNVTGTFNDVSSGLVTTASVSFAGARGAAYFASRSVGSSTGADVFFYVSGTARFGHFPAQGFISKRTLFDGDVVTSGTLQMVGAGYTSNIGSDTLLFVSGGTGTKGTAFSRGTSVFAGDLHISGNTFLGTVAEAMATTGSALTGTLTFNTAGQSVFYVSGTTGNITANFTNVPVFDGRVVSTNVILSQSSLGGGIVSAVQINSVASTILWANGVTPTANAGKHDVFGFSLIRSGTVWTTLGQMSTYG